VRDRLIGQLAIIYIQIAFLRSVTSVS